MGASRLALAAVLLSCSLAAAGEPRPRIKSADFPSVSRRAVFFEDRINAADAAVRRRVLMEVGYFFDIPDPEFVAFLRRMMRDADPVVCGRAVQKLHALFVPIAPKELPRKFTALNENLVIDLEDKKTVPDLVTAVQGGPGDVSRAAYLLGLLRHKTAALDLRKMAETQQNIYARYTAARALVDCGANDLARPVLEELTRSQLALYSLGTGTDQKPGHDGRQPYYATVACRALCQLGPADRKIGVERLIALLGFLERSDNANDQAYLPSAQQALAAVTGRYFVSQDQAREWYRKKYAK